MVVQQASAVPLEYSGQIIAVIMHKLAQNVIN